ncbi:MAG: electron transfer flavoprotein subunit beta/FixA family protein, partial [Desulfosarcinaceae bacterium]|nr:electron transfer flavoprotein subunit beta/FixA family protein [Desulfosarcinaceae bacterium]
EVIAVTVGQAAAAATLRQAMAMGAARGILVTVDGQFLDSITTAKALQAAIAKDGQPDLILAGKGAVDTEGFQTAYRLAAAMNLPVVNEINGLEVADGKAVVQREMDGGTRVKMAVNLPCVLGATKGLNEPRYPKFPDIMKAKKKPVAQMPLADLGVAAESTTELTKLEAVPERSGAEMLSGDLKGQVSELVRILKDEEKVI